MELGAFSISLSVKDLQASLTFYKKIGFSQVGGVSEQGWLILRNGTCTLGLFQGMFEKNMLTFNPGWISETEHLEQFQDVRDIQESLRSDGVDILQEAEPGDAPASIMIEDPDGNPILIDQHMPRPVG